MGIPPLSPPKLTFQAIHQKCPVPMTSIRIENNGTNVRQEEMSELEIAMEEYTSALSTFTYKVSQTKWGICPWGSCQYASDYALYRTMQILEANGTDPMQFFGWGKGKNLKVNRPLDDMVLKILEHQKEIEDDDLPDEDDEDYTTKVAERDARLEKIRKLKSCDECMLAMRNQSLDLWTVAKEMACHLTNADNLQLPNKTGLYCYILVKLGLVTQPAATFEGYDT